jgi:hypothetical protein
MSKVEARFWAKVEKTDECWFWTACKNPAGYGLFFLDSSLRKKCAHRVAYEWMVGPIPDGMFLDHICYNKGCVNPDHLRPVTNKQNIENLSGAHRDSQSGIRGVSWQKDIKRWRVQVRHGDRRYSGGCFTDLAEAEAAAIKLRNSLYTHNNADRGIVSNCQQHSLKGN